MVDTRHPFFPQLRDLLAEAASRRPVYDLGTSKRFAKEVGMARSLFDEDTYFAGGYKPENLGQPDGCDFHCDIQDIDLPDGVAGSVLCMEVLEHVQRPREAAKEIFRILKPGGIAIVSVPFLISYHGKSKRLENPVVDVNVDSSNATYGDFWRFTHEGLAMVFSEAGFTRVDVYPSEGRILTRLLMLGLYFKLVRIPGLMNLIARIDHPRLGRATTMHFVRAEKPA